MLKITTADDARRFGLEGRLAGPWVDTLDQCWREALVKHAPEEIVLDLSDVTFVDARGKGLLALIRAAGAALRGRGLMNTALIEDIDGRATPRQEAGSWLLFLSPILLSLIVAACSGVRAGEAARPGRGSEGATRPPTAVDIAPVVVGPLTESVEVVGSLAPKHAAEIKSEVTGTVAAVYVTEWVPVRRGALLARLDTTEDDAAIEAAQAGLGQARVAETRARREHLRALQLKEYGLITAQAVEDAQSAQEAAEATTAAASAQVHAAQARRAKSLIAAPLDGVIALRGVSVGDRVENMGEGPPMFRIVDNRLLELTLTVPSARLGAVRVGQRIEFSVDAQPDRTFTGEVSFINPTIDETTRAAKVIAEVHNSDATLKGGLFVRGRIVTSRAEALQVPREALLNWDERGTSADVFVVREGKVEKRKVRTGPEAGAAVAVESGLSNGENVVTRGGFALRAGDRVIVASEGT